METQRTLFPQTNLKSKGRIIQPNFYADYEATVINTAWQCFKDK